MYFKCSLQIAHNVRHNTTCWLSSSSAAITRIHRKKYQRMYPTKVILPDGASITVRYKDPKQLIVLPLDLTTLSEEEVKKRLEQRRPKEKLKIEVEEAETFSYKSYVQLVKKKK